MRMRRIVRDPEVLGGQPVIKGTRITVQLILERLAAGERPEDIVKEYARLRVEDVHAALEFGAYVVSRLSPPRRRPSQER